MSQPPIIELEVKPHERTYRQLVGTPTIVPAFATVKATLQIEPGDFQVVLTFTNQANISALSVVGLGTGATYASLSASPGQSFVVIPLVESSDDRLTLSVTASGAGGVIVYATAVRRFTGLVSTLPAFLGQQVDNYVFDTASSLWVPQQNAKSVADGSSGLNTLSDAAQWMRGSGGSFDYPRTAEGLGQGSAARGLQAAVPFQYNGSTYDPEQNNVDFTILPSAARTSTAITALFTNTNARGIICVVNVTAVSGTTPTLAFQFNAWDPINSVNQPLGAIGTNITGTSTVTLALYPATLAAGNLNVVSALPRIWYLVYVIGGTTPSFTFSVTGMYLL